MHSFIIFFSISKISPKPPLFLHAIVDDTRITGDQHLQSLHSAPLACLKSSPAIFFFYSKVRAKSPKESQQSQYNYLGLQVLISFLLLYLPNIGLDP